MMAQVPLRIRFLALLLIGVLAVTIATVLVVRHAVENQIRAEIFTDLRTSVLTFRAFQAEREITLNHSAELLADLPTVKALMTTQDVATIQDASNATWDLSGGDLLALAEPNGRIMAVHAKARDVTRDVTQEALMRSVRLPAGQQWWFLKGHLYEVFLQPIYFGSAKDGKTLGVLALGYEIDERAANYVSRIAESQVTFLYGDSVVATTIAPSMRQSFAAESHATAKSKDLSIQDIQLGQERYFSTLVEVSADTTPAVRLSVLKSYDEATARFRGLYRTLAGLGVLAFLGQSVLAFAAFRRSTRPLERLVAGVRALGKGDFSYPLESDDVQGRSDVRGRDDVFGRDELSEVTAAFIRMRDDLRQTQKQLLEAERLATIGRMASSISHDLRHQLTPIVANSEFLSESNLDPEQSAELYREISDAVGRMTELIDSLLEFAKTREDLSPSYGSVKDTAQKAIRSVQSHPSVHNVKITLSRDGNCEGWFDSRKLERAFYNLLLNACQAAPSQAGEVKVHIQESSGGVGISVSDNGPGIPEHLHAKIFEPFVSYGKENGTGLGLTIVQKLLAEHGGSVKLAERITGWTTFQLWLPLNNAGSEAESEDVPAVTSGNPTSTE
jgi:signal transduction histidine kinase